MSVVLLLPVVLLGGWLWAGTAFAGPAATLAFPAVRVQNWKTAHGLPHNAVECLLQSREGWLWIGTREGLARFDGLKFTIFNQQSDGFTDEAIVDLAEDAEGALWVATKHGLYRKRGLLFDRFTTAQGLPHNQINDLALGSDGSLWIASGGGLSRFRAMGFTHFAYATTLVGPQLVVETNCHVAAVLEDSHGNVWAGTAAGLVHLDPASGAWRHIWRDAVPTNNTGLGTPRVIFEGRDGGLWFGTDLALVCKQGEVFTRYPMNEGADDPRCTAISEAADGTIWCAKGGTLFRCRDGELTAETGPGSMSHLFVTDVFGEGTDNHWLATRFGGLIRLKPRALHTLTTQDGLCHARVTSVAPSIDGGVWIGTVRGAQQLRDGAFTFPNVSPASEADSFNWIVDPRRMSCRALFEDSAGDVWAGTVRSGDSDLWWLQRTPGGFRRQPAIVAGYPSAFCEDRERRIWVGSSDGITCLSTNVVTYTQRSPLPGQPLVLVTRPRADRWFARPAGVRFERGLEWAEIRNELGTHSHQGEKPSGESPSAGLLPALLETAVAPFPLTRGFSTYPVRAIREDGRGGLWFGTWGGGVNHFVGGGIENFSRTNGLAGDFVHWLQADNDGAMWVGTSEGLSRIRDGRVATVTVRQGLPDNAVHQILEDGLGYFWIGGRRGLFRIARVDLIAVAENRATTVEGVLLDEGDGMVTSETANAGHHTACRTPDGQLWFATAQGVVVVAPGRARTLARPPRAYIEFLRTSEQRLELSSHWPFPTRTRAEDTAAQAHPVAAPAPRPSGAARAKEPGTVTLVPGSGRHLEFHFTAPDFDAPEKLLFQYRLDGHDRDWVDAAERRVAYYANLRPGRYCFRVRAGHAYGLWGESGAAAALRIAPFFYQTWWFGALCGATVLAGVALAYGSRVSAIRTRQRAEITRAFHDRLAGKLSAIVKAAQPSPSADAEALSSIAQLAQVALRNLRLAMSSNDPCSGTLDALVTQLIQSAEELLVPLKIGLRLEVPVEIPGRRVSPHVRERVSLILSETLNNIIKHAQATTVFLRMQLSPCHLVIQVQDDGKGFAPDAPGPGHHGLAHIREHAAAIDSDLEIQSALGRGTTVQVTVPLQRGRLRLGRFHKRTRVAEF